MAKLRKLVAAPLSYAHDVASIGELLTYHDSIQYGCIPYGVRVLTTSKGLQYAETGKRVENADVRALFAEFTPGLDGWLSLTDGFPNSPSTAVRTEQFLKGKLKGLNVRPLKFHIYDAIIADRGMSILAPATALRAAHSDFDSRRRFIADAIGPVMQMARTDPKALPWAATWGNNLAISLITVSKVPSFKFWDRLARNESAYDGLIVRKESGGFGYSTATRDSGTRAIYRVTPRKRMHAEVISVTDKPTAVNKVFGATFSTIRCESYGNKYDVVVAATAHPEELAIAKQGDIVMVSHEGFGDDNLPKRPVIIGVVELKR